MGSKSLKITKSLRRKDLRILWMNTWTDSQCSVAVQLMIVIPAEAEYVFSDVWLKWPSPSLASALLESAVRCPQGTALEAATHSLLILLGGSLIPMSFIGMGMVFPWLNTYEAGIQGYRSFWIPHQVRNDSPSNYERQSNSGDGRRHTLRGQERVTVIRKNYDTVDTSMSSVILFQGPS